MINLNYYKITSNSDACNVFKHFKELENKLEEIYIRYETAYHKGPYYDRITIFFDKHFDSFCKREFFYHRICLNKYRLDNIKNYKWQTTNFTFKINLSKSRIGYSFGVKGFRIGKTAKGKTEKTISLPGTGLSYKTIKKEESVIPKKTRYDKSKLKDKTFDELINDAAESFVDHIDK